MKKITPQSQQAWTNAWYDTNSTGGRFVRTEAKFRNWITTDGSAGPTGSGGFTPDSGRYHLYVSLACPWAHRTLLSRILLNLVKHVSVSVTRPWMGPDSWQFDPQQGRLFRYEGDDDEYVDWLYELYRLCDPEYDARATVPVLWDKKQQTIVSNESAEIVRMFNNAFRTLEPDTPDLYPLPLRSMIDELNDWIYPRINNGVYRAGFATTQQAYEEAVYPLFEALDELENRLARQRYLCGEQLTESDLRLFPTLVRFDSVYAGHFKCGLRRIVDYPNLWAYTRDIYQMPGFAETVDMEYNKLHYYGSHDTINPTGIIPAGPVLDFMAPHGRD